ncbi:uncharacterized protein AB675_3189 [Cyphellophora attinorum]|uniref:Transcription factor domain-containing protein n=1 Tax=Cyphellophora attinorum TaxID=1664694 RepID=A0A0N1NXW6_9EURO|nr:uncharacterized protein AB675_3189 [Phialophora attinorum]KPI37973.1 hypothetical protein AB675_3189 [Phialophora attinorum]
MAEPRYIEYLPDKRATARARGLQIAQIRSHTATVHHARRARQRHSPVGQQFRPQLTCSVCSNAVLPVQEEVPLQPGRRRTRSNEESLLKDDEAEETDSQLASTDSVPLETSLTCFPDYFGAVRWACESIDYYNNADIPFHDTATRVFNVRNVMAELFNSAFVHQVSTHSAVAFSEYLLDRQRRPGLSPSATVLKNLTVAISRLRNYLLPLDGPPDDGALLGVLSIVVVAQLMGDADAVHLHNKSLLPLVQARGGINNLGIDSLLRVGLLQYESTWNAPLGTAKARVILFPEARAPSDPLPARLSPSMPLVDSDGLALAVPLGFRRLRRYLSLSTVEAIARTARIVATGGSMVSLPGSANTQYRDFWETCPCLRIEEVPGVPSNLEKVVVLALILYCMSAFYVGPRSVSMTYTGFRDVLGVCLRSRCTAANTEDESAALAWCCMCLVESWYSPAKKTWPPPGRSLIEEMKRGFPQYHGRVDELTATLRLFFISDDIERRMRVYWTTEDVEALGTRP